MKAGWEVKPLDKCIEPFKISGKIPRKKFQPEGPYPIISQEADYINGYWSEEANVNVVRKPLVVFGDHTQVVKYIDFDFVVGADGVKILQPKDELDAKFFAYFLEAHPVASLGYARHFRHMRSLSVPIPPLEEQKQIVAVLDAAFEGLTRAKENAETNLQNARELFEEAKDEILTASDDTWLRGKLEVLVGPVATGPFGSLLHKSDYVFGQTPIVNPAHIIDGKITPDLSKTIGSETMARLTSYVMKKGDIVIGRRGDMGRCATVGEVEDGWLCGTGSFYIRPSENVEPELVSHILRSRSYVAKLESLSTGATMLNISNKTLAALELVLPPSTQQSALLLEIDCLAEKTVNAEANYRTKLTDIADLRKSLLQKAFAGELT